MRGVTILYLLFFSACRLPVVTGEAPVVNQVRKGEKFRINLPEDHSKVMLWQLDPGFNDKAVTRLSEVWHGNEKGIDFNFNCRDTGLVQFTFILRSYADTACYKRFVVKITDN